MTAIMDTEPVFVHQSKRPSHYEVAEAPWQEYLSSIRFLAKYANHDNNDFANILVKNTQLLHQTLLHCDYYQQTIRAMTQAKVVETPGRFKLFTASPIKAQIVTIPACQAIRLAGTQQELHILLNIQGKLSEADSENAKHSNKLLKLAHEKWTPLFKLWIQPKTKLTRGKVIVLLKESIVKNTLAAGKNGCILLHIQVPQLSSTLPPTHAADERKTRSVTAASETAKHTLAQASALEATLY